jgi:hypothetical protein
LAKSAIHPRFSVKHLYPEPPGLEDINKLVSDPSYFISLVNCTFHLDKNLRAKDYEQKAVGGFLLSYATPAPSTSTNQAVQRGNDSKNATNKRMRIQPSPGTKMMIFGDLMPNSSQTFCIVLPNRSSLLLGYNNSNLMNDLTLGDGLIVYEPQLSNRTLGSSIPVLCEWKYLIPLRRNLNWIPKSIQMSSEANTQICFVQHGCTVTLSNVLCITGNDVPCVGTTCDRQLLTCSNGCHGMPKIRKNYVISAVVEIENQPHYNAATSVATFTLRSYEFTKLLIRDIGTFDAQTIDEMKQHNMKLRKAARDLSEYINDNGGWTVIGWHRRGLMTTGQDGAQELSSDTKGHLVRLEPTNCTESFFDGLKEYRFTMD